MQAWPATAPLHPAYRAAMANVPLMTEVARRLYARDATIGQRQLCTLLSQALHAPNFGTVRPSAPSSRTSGTRATV